MNARDKAHVTPLSTAVEAGQLGVAALLLQRGADLFACVAPLREPWRLLVAAARLAFIPESAAAARAILEEQLRIVRRAPESGARAEALALSFTPEMVGGLKAPCRDKSGC